MLTLKTPVHKAKSKRCWEAPEFSVLALNERGKSNSQPTIGAEPPSPLLPPLMAKDIGDTDRTQPGGSNVKPGGSADMGGHDWGP